MGGYINQPSTSNASTSNRKTMLFVLANGRTQEMPCKVVLTEPDIESWDLILDLIARNLDFPAGVQYLYTVAGDAVRNPRSLQNANIYVAVPRNEEFTHLDYVKVFRSLLPMREVDLKRIDMSSEHPQQVNDPITFNVVQTGDFSLRHSRVGESKSDGMATINNTGNNKNLFCHQSKKRPVIMEVSQVHDPPGPATSKRIQTTPKPCGDVQDDCPSETKARCSTSEIPGNDAIKEEIRHLLNIKKQPNEYPEFIEAWLLEVLYNVLDESEDKSSENDLEPNNDLRSDDGYLTSDERDSIDDLYKKEEEQYTGFDDCRKQCEETSIMPQTESAESHPDSTKDTESDLSHDSDKADDIPSIDLEFDENMSVSMGSKNFIIAVTVEEPGKFDEESSTENSTTPVSSGSSSEKLDSNAISNHEMINSNINKNDQKLFEENLISPCKLPNCPTNRVPQHVTVYQSSFGSTTNKGQPAGASCRTGAVANTNRTLQKINGKNNNQNLKPVLKCPNSLKNGVKLVNNNHDVPARNANSPRASCPGGNRKDTSNSVEATKKQCHPAKEKNGGHVECSPQVVQRPKSKGADKSIIIKQSDAAYNSYASNPYESTTTICSPHDCPLKVIEQTHEAPRAASVVDDKPTSVPSHTLLCSPHDCPLRNNKEPLSHIFEQSPEAPAESPPLSFQKQNYGTSNAQRRASPISNDSTIGHYTIPVTPPNSLATTSSYTKGLAAPVATKTKQNTDKCEEVCQPCPFNDGKIHGMRKIKPQSVSMPSKNGETKTRAVSGNAPSVRNGKLASTCVKGPLPNNRSSAPSSSQPKNIPVKRRGLNDYKAPIPHAKATNNKTSKPQNQIINKPRYDKPMGTSAPCKTCRTKAVANSKIKSSSPPQVKRYCVTESPVLKTKQVKVDSDEQDKKYCYPQNCELKDKKIEIYCDPISCQDECVSEKGHAIAIKEPELKLEVVSSTEESTSAQEPPVVDDDHKNYCYRETCKLKDERILEKHCEPNSCLDECVNNENTNAPESLSIAEGQSGDEEFVPDHVADNKKYCYPETCIMHDKKSEKYCVPISCQDECQHVETRPISNLQHETTGNAEPHEERRLQLPIQNIPCMPITCDDKNMGCLKKSERKPGVKPKMLENVPAQLRRSIPENTPVRHGQCTSKIKPVKPRLNKTQKQEVEPSAAKANVSTIKQPEETRQRSIPQGEPVNFVQCQFKNKQIPEDRHVQILCPFRNHISTNERGVNPIKEVVPVIESAVVQTDVVRETSTQCQNKEDIQENKATKYCYLDTCQYKDRKQPNKIKLRSTTIQNELQEDSGNETAEDDLGTPPAIRKCKICIPTEENNDDKHPQIVEPEESPKSYPKQPDENFEKYCYLESCQVNNENVEVESDAPISKTKCKICGVVQIVERIAETEIMAVEEDKIVKPGPNSVIIKESVQFIREVESPPEGNTEDDREDTEDLQPNWENFSEELEEYCYSDFPDWRKNCCLANDCSIHVFKKSFTRNSMPPTIVEVDEDVLLDGDLSGSITNLSESEKIPESNLEPPDSEQVSTGEPNPIEDNTSATSEVANEPTATIKGFHCPKCHVELLVIGDDTKNINVEKQGELNECAQVCETFLAKQRLPTLSVVPEKLIEPEISTEEKVEEPPVVPNQDDIQEAVPTTTETTQAKSLSKTNETNRIIFAPQIGSYVSEAEFRASSSTENSPLRSTASIQKVYKERYDGRKEIEQTPSQFINDIIRSSKVVIDKFKLKPKGMSSLGIKEPKCPDHLKQPGQKDQCCGCPSSNTVENKGYENFENAQNYDLYIFTNTSDDETSPPVPSEGTKETSQEQPCVTTIENLGNYSRIYVPKFVTPVNFTQTYIATPLKEERHGCSPKNDSAMSTSSHTNLHHTSKRKVSIKQDEMLQPLAIRYSVQEQPSPDCSEKPSAQDSNVVRSKDSVQHSVHINIGKHINEPISLTTSTTTLHIVKGLVDRKTENCIPASLKEENQSKRLSGNTLESRASRIPKCYCKEKTCTCRFECLGRKLNAIHGEMSASGGLRKSARPRAENGRKSGLSTPSILTPVSLSGLIVGENSSEYNGPAAMDLKNTVAKSTTGSPLASNSEQKESLLQISPENQERSFESMNSVPVVTDDKNKKE